MTRPDVTDTEIEHLARVARAAIALRWVVGDSDPALRALDRAVDALPRDLIRRLGHPGALHADD